MLRYLAACIIALCIATVVPQEERFSKNIAVVVDTSGSMRTSVRESMEAFRLVTDQPIDEMNLAVVAFADQAALWGWRKLPDADALREAEEWLSVTRGTLGHGTRPAVGITQAMRLDKEQLSVVLVTDGVFWTEGGVGPVISAIHTLQQERKEKGFDPAVICCIGVLREKKDSLIKIASVGKGGYFRWMKD